MMNADLQKHSEVHKWLTDIFGPNGIPDYEICDQTVDILYSVMKLNHERDEDCKRLIADAKTKCVQYQTEAKRIEDVLKEVSMTPSSLPPHVFGKLKALVNVAQHLQVQKVETSSLCSALHELVSDDLSTKIELKRAEFETKKLEKKVLSTSQVREHLQNGLTHALNEVEDQEAKSRGYENAADLARKQIWEHKEKIAHYEAVLLKSRFSKAISHEELLEKNEQLKALQVEFKELKEELDGYHNLPVDLSLVGEKVSEAKQHLKDLEETINQHDKNLHDTFSISHD